MGRATDSETRGHADAGSAARRFVALLPVLLVIFLVLGPARVQSSYTGEVLLPRMGDELKYVMEMPFSPIAFSEEQISMSFLGTTDEELRSWLYHQIIALGVGQSSWMTMIYMGLEDGRFLGYFSNSSYTERASSGLAADLSWMPYTLDEVNDAVDRGDIRGVSGKTVETSCPEGARDSVCTSQSSEPVNAIDQAACLHTAGNTWYAPCTADCCDAHIRNYYTTSFAARGAPINVTRWRTYDHKARPWYKQCKYSGAKWSSPYEFATSQSLGLTAMATAKGPTGDLLGVLAIDYEVGGLGALLSQSLRRLGAWGYAVERSNGKLVAISTGETLYSSTMVETVGFSESRLSAINASHESIAVSATMLAALEWPENYYYQSASTDAGYEFQTAGLKSNGLDWLLVAGQDIHCQPSEIWDSMAGICQTCAAGAIPMHGRCTICPPHSSPHNNQSACHCNVGYYSLPGDTQCFVCPSSLVCGGGPIGSTWPLPPPGWWYDYELAVAAADGGGGGGGATSIDGRLNDDHVFQCESSRTCVGSTDGRTCDNSDDTGQRGIGYSCCSPTTDQNSTLCGSCKPGFAFVAGRCSKCDEVDTGSVLVYLFVCCGLIAVLWFRSATYRHTSKFFTFVFFLQNLALQLDDSVRGMRFFNSIVLLDMDPISADRCLMDIGFVGKWVIANVLIPVLMATLLGIVCVLDQRCIYPSRRQAGNVLAPYLRLKKSLFELATIWAFPSCLWSLKAIICRLVNGRNGEVYLLSDDSSIECYGPQHVVVYAGGIILLILNCTFAATMLFAIGLRQFRQEHAMVVSRERALAHLHTAEPQAATPGDELTGCAEVKECLKRIGRKQDLQLRVNKDYQTTEAGKLKMRVGQRIILRNKITDQTWSGHKPDAPKEDGEFPRDCVDLLNADSVTWNKDLVSHDPLASSFYPIQVSRFWYPFFLLLVRLMMVFIYAAGNVHRLDGNISLNGTVFQLDIERSGVVVSPHMNWKAFATLLLTVHLVVQLKGLPFRHQDQNDFETLCTLCLLTTGLCFLGTEHDVVARISFYIIMFFFAAAIVWTETRGSTSTSAAQARTRLRTLLLKLRVGVILVSSQRHQRKRRRNGGARKRSATPEPPVARRSIELHSTNEATVAQTTTDKPFYIDDSKDESGTQKEEIVQLLEKDPHTDDFAENQIEILTEKLKKNEWPALRGLNNVGGGRRPQDCLELLEAMMHLREPLHTLVIDLSHQDPVILDVMHNLCVQDTLQSIADSFPAEEEHIELMVLRSSGPGLTHHLQPNQQYDFSIRGPILQFAPDPSVLGVSRMTPLANLGSCSVKLIQSRNTTSTIKIMKGEKLLCFLAPIDTSPQKQAEMERWREHLDQVCKDFKHRESELRHTINIGPLFERPLELCVYLADCSTRLVYLFPTEADELQALAEQFEQHACDMIDQCESGAEAEAALRSAGTALLNGADVYIFALQSGLKSLMSSKLVKQYTEDVWTGADVHLHRTGIDADLRQDNDPDGVALARMVKIEDKRFQKAVGRRVGPVSIFPFILVQRVFTTAAECALIVLVSPIAEIMSRSEQPALAQFCRRRLAMYSLTWSYPEIKCYMALLLHLSLLGLVLFSASHYSPVVVPTEFSWTELGIYFYALGFFLAELYQLKNLLLERVRVQSLHEAYLLAVEDWDDTIVNLKVALEEYTRSANQLDIIIAGLFFANYILKRQELAGRIDGTSDQSEERSQYVFGVNILLLVLRFLDLCSFNRHLGPLWITLQSMIQDILLFSFIAAALIVAFSGCLQVVFWRQPDVFFYAGDTVEFVLMTFFGEYDTEDLYKTEPIWGRFIMITLLVLGTIVQLNLLIAMLTSTYEDKKDHSAAEWRLVRARIVVEFSDAVRSAMELPLLNIVYFTGSPVLRLLFPAVWSGNTEKEPSEDWLRSPPALRTGLPYYYNDRRSLYLQNTADFQGELSVTVHRAKNLLEATYEHDGLNEAYCTVSIGPQKHETEIAQEQRDTGSGERFAIWEEEVKLGTTQRFRDPLQITVFDSDYGRDDSLGRVELPLSKKMLTKLKGKPSTRWYRVRSFTNEGQRDTATDPLLAAGHEPDDAAYAEMLITLAYSDARSASNSLNTSTPRSGRKVSLPQSTPTRQGSAMNVEQNLSTDPELMLTFMMRDYRHPFVTFYEQPRMVTVRAHDTLRSIIDVMFVAQQNANDVDVLAEGWHRDNIIVAHVPRECLSDMRHFVGPFEAKEPSRPQRCTTLLGLELDTQPDKCLRDYFCNGRRPAAVDRLLTESVFLLLRNDKEHRPGIPEKEWAYLKKNPQQELHLRSQQRANADRATKLVLHKELLQKFAELQEQVTQIVPQEAVPPKTTERSKT